MLLGYLLRQYRRWREYRRAYNELASLDDRMLRDIHINRSEIPGIARQAALTVN